VANVLHTLKPPFKPPFKAAETQSVVLINRAYHWTEVGIAA
jgi:hypothetical protein